MQKAAGKVSLYPVAYTASSYTYKSFLKDLIIITLGVGYGLP
jgi:hypothetical protein